LIGEAISLAYPEFLGIKATGSALAGLGRRARGSGEPENLPGIALNILRSENGGRLLKRFFSPPSQDRWRAFLWGKGVIKGRTGISRGGTKR